jgi:pimeloyl-ACP methyl ester carboxylesterase
MSSVTMSCAAATPALHHVALGQGEMIVLLHGSASTGALWRQTMQTLQPLYRLIAPDLTGYGRSPRPDVPYTIDSEVRAVASLLPCCAEKYHLVGHSYGGVVALALALAHPARLRTLILIEPVYFAALRYVGQEAAYRRFVEVRDAFVATLARGEIESAMRDFVAFWAGEGTWEKAPAETRATMLQATARIALDWRASFRADMPLGPLAALGPRTLLVCGERSPEPMLKLVDALHTIMPGSVLICVAGAGHSLPLTHAADLTRTMVGHLHVEAERRLR